MRLHITSRSGIDDSGPLELKCTLLRRFNKTRINQRGDIPGLPERLIDHGWKFRTLVRFDQHQLRPSDLAFNFLFPKDNPLYHGFFIDSAVRRPSDASGFFADTGIRRVVKPPPEPAKTQLPEITTMVISSKNFKLIPDSREPPIGASPVGIKY